MLQCTRTNTQRIVSSNVLSLSLQTLMLHRKRRRWHSFETCRTYRWDNIGNEKRNTHNCSSPFWSTRWHWIDHGWVRLRIVLGKIRRPTRLYTCILCHVSDFRYFCFTTTIVLCFCSCFVRVECFQCFASRSSHKSPTTACSFSFKHPGQTFCLFV